MRLRRETKGRDTRPRRAAPIHAGAGCTPSLPLSLSRSLFLSHPQRRTYTQRTLMSHKSPTGKLHQCQIVESEREREGERIATVGAEKEREGARGKERARGRKTSGWWKLAYIFRRSRYIPFSRVRRASKSAPRDFPGARERRRRAREAGSFPHFRRKALS